VSRGVCSRASSMAQPLCSLPSRMSATREGKAPCIRRLTETALPRLQADKPVVLLLGSGWGAHSIMKVRTRRTAACWGPSVHPHLPPDTPGLHTRTCCGAALPPLLHPLAMLLPSALCLPGHRCGPVRGGLRVAAQPLPGELGGRQGEGSREARSLRHLWQPCCWLQGCWIGNTQLGQCRSC